MSQPAANYRNVNSCRDKTRRRGVAKRMRRDSLIRQGRNPLGSRRHVLPQLEANAGSFERTSVPIDKHRFIFPARLLLQKGPHQTDSLRPERTDSLFSAFPEQSNLAR